MSTAPPPPRPCTRKPADPDQHYLPMSKVVPPAPCGSSTAHRVDDVTVSRRAAVDIRMVPDQASCEGTTTIVLLFSQDVTSPPSVVIEDNEVLDDVILVRINSRSFKFTAPRHAEGSVDVLVRPGGHLNETRHRLSYISASLRLSRGLTLLYVRQLNAVCELVLRQHEKPVADPRAELDRALASSIGDTSSTDTVPAFVYEELFGIYKNTSATDTDDVNGSCDKPTLLHLAAAHGLTALAVRLTDLPDSNLATAIKDNKGRVPGEVARQNGHTNAAAVFARLAANSIGGGGGSLSGSSSSLAKSESTSDISSRRNNSQKDRPESKQDGITRVHSGVFPPNNDVYQMPPPPRPVSKDSWTSRNSGGSARDSDSSRNSAEARDSGVRSSQSSAADDDEDEDRDGEDGVDSSYMDMSKMVDNDAPPSCRAPPPPATRPQRSNSTLPPPKPRCAVVPRAVNSVYDVPKQMNDYDVPRHCSDSSADIEAPPSTKAPPPPRRGGSDSCVPQPPPLAPRQDPSAPPVTPRRDVLIRSTMKPAGHQQDPPERPGLPPRPSPAGGASSNRRPSLQAAMNNQQLC